MPSIASKSLAEWTGGTWHNEPAESITGFCFDARLIQPGQCFVALSGGARDGHDFIQQAAQGGAVAALVEQPQALTLPQLQVPDTLAALGLIAGTVRGQFSKPVVAVTGSCGKTSTKEMLRILLGEERTHATAGNWNNLIGVPMTLFGLDSATQDFAVIEAGINQADEMGQLGQMIQADLNVLTNIGPAHLELLGSLENVASEKSLLAQHAVEDSPILLPAEELCYHAYAALAARAIVLLPEGAPAPKLPVRQVVRYEIVADASLPVRNQQTLRIDNQTYTIFSPSRGIASNAALAIVAAQQLGIANADIQQRIEKWRPSSSRGRIETVGGQTFYVDCYNANPASMVDALEAFVRSAPQDVARFYILGAMNELGATAVEQHQAIGRTLQLRVQDHVAFIGPATLTQAYAAGAASDRCICTETVEKIKSTVAQFQGAIFLKGSRSYQLEQLLPEHLIPNS